MFTNVALTDDGDVWGRGMTKDGARAPHRLEGSRLDSGVDELSSPPQQPLLHPHPSVPDPRAEDDDPNGVPIDASSRRSPHDDHPVGNRGPRLDHGTFMGATLSSGPRPRRTVRSAFRRDPMAMLPFIGYDAGTTSATGSRWPRTTTSRSPKIFYVTLVPVVTTTLVPVAGLRREQPRPQVVVDRIEGNVDAVETPIGLVPAPAPSTPTGSTSPRSSLRRPRRRRRRVEDRDPEINEWFETFGDKLPAVSDRARRSEGPPRGLSLARRPYPHAGCGGRAVWGAYDWG